MRHISVALVLLTLLLSPVAVLGQQEEEPISLEGFRQTGRPTTDPPRGDSPRDNPGGVSAARASSSLSLGGASVVALEPTLYRGDITATMRITYNLRDTRDNTYVVFAACEDIRDRSDPCWNSSLIDGGYYDRDEVYSGDTNDCPTRDGQIHATYTRVQISAPRLNRTQLAESPDNDNGEFYTGYKCREND